MAQYELNLMDYWQIINRRRIVIIIIFFVVFLGAVLYTEGIEPQYQAFATLMITEQRSFSTVLMELSGAPIGDPMI